MSILPSRIWVSSNERKTLGRPALFLDRDGVLVEEVDYLRRREDVRLAAGAAELVTWANRQSIPVIVVSNQSGIARGLMDWNAYEAVEAEIARLLDASRAHIDLTLACPFHPAHTQDYGAAHAEWRKPGPGMLRLAANMLGIVLSDSWMIGDKASDVGAAKSAGLHGAIHVLSGHGNEEREAALKSGGGNIRVLTARDIDDAAELLGKEAAFDQPS